MRSLVSRVVAAAWLTACGSSAFAQHGRPDVAIVDAPTSASCVLHVWPSADAHSAYLGWFHGGAVDGDRRGIKGYPALHAEVLTTAVQRQLLTNMDWPKLLTRPGVSVVVHDQPPSAQDDQARSVPLIADRPSCYQELLLHSVFVEKAALSTSSVRVMIIAKTWHGAEAAPSTFSAMAEEKVNLTGDPGPSIKQGFSASVRKLLRAGYFQQQ